MKKSSREEALKIARFIGCTGAHQDDTGNWLPCASAKKLMEISAEAESSTYKPAEKSEDEKKKRGSRRRYIKPGYEPLGERGVLSIETLPDGSLVSGKELEFEDYELIELKAESYTKPNLRESIKRRIMAGSRGGKPGEWSARKAQLLAMEYRRAGGGYRGGKKKPQRSLDKWTEERWTTSDGKPAIREGGTTRYLPEEAWRKLTPAQREATNRKKRNASQRGRQFVANTERARQAGSAVRNSQKSMIVTRARPRKGDPDVYDDPDSARLRARALGCIGIARRETPDGDYVWTPCTNVSDFRRRTGQSVLGQRDEIRRFRRRLERVGSSAFGRSGKTLFSAGAETKGLTSIMNMPTIGRRFGRGLSAGGRRKCKGINFRDGDGDGFICNPVTGQDDLPVVNGNPIAANLLAGIRKDERDWKQRWQKAHGSGKRPEFNEKQVDAIIPKLIARGFIVEIEGTTLKIKPPPSFRRMYLAKAALERREIDPVALDRIGYHKYHKGNDPNRPIMNITGDLLDLFGYDPVNDVIYSPYFDSPDGYGAIKDGIPRKYAHAVVDEDEGNYLTDSPKIQSIKSSDKKTLSGLMKHRESLDEEQKKNRLLALIDEFKKRGYHDKDPMRDIISDTEWLDAVTDHFQHSDLGGEEIAQILNIDSDKLHDVFDELGIKWRPSPTLEALREDERQRLREEERERIASEQRYKLPKLGRLNLLRSRGKEQITSEEFMEYMKFVAWEQELYNDAQDGANLRTVPKLAAPGAAIVQPLLDQPGNERLRHINNKYKNRRNVPVELQWDFYRAVQQDAADMLQSGNVSDTLGPLITAVGYTGDPTSDRYTEADFLKVLSILSRAKSSGDARRQLRQARLEGLLKGLHVKFGALPPLEQIYADLDRGARVVRPNPGPRRQAVKSLQPIAHIVPISFKVVKTHPSSHLDDLVVTELSAKLAAHNANMRHADNPDWSITNLDALKTVYSRGISQKTALYDDGAMARVDAFLRILKSGQPTNRKYVSDNDLLHKDHPWGKRKVREITYINTEAFEVKAFPFRRIGDALRNLRGGAGGGRGGGKIRKRFARFNMFARDADNDGKVQEGTTAERAAKPDSQSSQFIELLNRLKDPGGGFTYSMSSRDDVRSGWAIARKDKGIRLSADKVFDENGDITEDGIDSLHAFMLLHQDIFNQQPDNKRRIALGAWHNDEDGQIYFDVTDVYSKDFMDLDQAKAEARKQNQISLADLDELHSDGEDRTPFHDGGGNGGDLIPESQYNLFLKAVKDQRTKTRPAPMKPKKLRKANTEDKRVDVAEDRVAMMIAAPIKDLAAYHKDKQKWEFVRALPAEERKRIADAYDRAPDLSASEIQEEAREAYEALVKEVEEQFEILTKKLGIKIEFTDDDPYENYFEMRDDFIQNRRLKILKTSVTGGHPFMTDEQNDKFRAVHDAFGHLATGRGFDRHGEEAAYQAHKSMFGPLAVKAAATELRGQNAFLLDRGFFGPQKLVILPSDMRKFLLTLLATKEGGQDSLVSAQKASDNDNGYTKTGSHHVSCGRSLRS